MNIPSNSLLAITISRVGYFRAGKVLEVIVTWALAMREAGDDWPTGHERGQQERRLDLYRAHWSKSRPTVFRDLARFRAAFPDEVDPSRLGAYVLDQVDATLTEQEMRNRAPDLVGLVVPPWAV